MPDRLAPDDLDRNTLTVRMCGSLPVFAIEALIAECRTLTAERDALAAERERAWAALLSAGAGLAARGEEETADAVRAVAGHFARLCREEAGRLAAERDEALKRAEDLADAIRAHRDQHADDRCWMDDFDLYSALDDGATPDNRVGDKAEMLKNCERFLATRCAGGKWTSYAELTAERDRLAAAARDALGRLSAASELVIGLDGRTLDVAMVRGGLRHALDTLAAEGGG